MTHNPFPSKFTLAIASVFALALTSCNNDDTHHQPQQDQELITTVQLKLVNQADSADVREIAFRDLDGEGGQNGIVLPDTLRLGMGQSYFAAITVLDESDPAHVHDITPEIEAEATSHRFYYFTEISSGLNIYGFDTDANGLPFGQEATIATLNQPMRGELKIVLSHYTSPKGNSTSTSETDIEVTFPTSIEN